ncbi:MAG: hypothetical protein ACYCYP_05665 [Leptospirales bacterium]
MSQKTPSPLSLPKVRLAIIGIPLCIFGIFLIFYLKPTSGGSVQGLAILTAVIQAFGAIGIVLFFTALLEYLKARSSSKMIKRTHLNEGELLKQAHYLGERSCIDTCPHPEHKDEWVETVAQILGGSLQDLFESHPVRPDQYPKIIKEVGAGVTDLLRRQNQDRVSFSLSPDEVIALIPRVTDRLSGDSELIELLEKGHTHGRQPIPGTRHFPDV